MIDYHANLVATLNTILPTHYEMVLTSKTAIPCISYMELNNYVSTTGNERGYSVITYQVKVWAKSIEEIQRYANEVDKALRPIGFKRISTNELYDNNSSMIQKIMTFECLALEEY
jgi:hypothetical protein